MQQVEGEVLLFTESDTDRLPVIDLQLEIYDNLCNKQQTSDFSVQKENVFNPDAAKWGCISKEMVKYIIFNLSPQNINLLSETERIFSRVKRSLTIAHFFNIKINGGKL